MPILDRAELERSPLADLHAIASELGVEGYRGLRKDALIDAVIAQSGGEAAPAGGDDDGGDDASAGGAQSSSK